MASETLTINFRESGLDKVANVLKKAEEYSGKVVKNSDAHVESARKLNEELQSRNKYSKAAEQIQDDIPLGRRIGHRTTEISYWQILPKKTTMGEQRHLSVGQRQNGSDANVEFLSACPNHKYPDRLHEFLLWQTQIPFHL